MFIVLAHVQRYCFRGSVRPVILDLCAKLMQTHVGGRCPDEAPRVSLIICDGSSTSCQD